MVRQLRDNLYVIGYSEDIERFMFGSERESLRRHLDSLVELQRGHCLYCGGRLTRAHAHVDHFVPWSLNRCDAFPNLVAAHAACNLAKGDSLAAEPHLDRWTERNEWKGINSSVDRNGAVSPIDHNVASIARWAYDRAYVLGLPVWLQGHERVPLTSNYRSLLAWTSAECG